MPNKITKKNKKKVVYVEQSPKPSVPIEQILNNIKEQIAKKFQEKMQEELGKKETSSKEEFEAKERFKDFIRKKYDTTWKDEPKPQWYLDEKAK